MKRGDVKIDLLAILVSSNFPPQYQLRVKGSTPIPCHHQRVQAAAPTIQSEIHVQIRSPYDRQLC
jgi:hypothetical protein